MCVNQAGLGKEDAPSHSHTSAKTGMRFTVPRCFKYAPPAPLNLGSAFALLAHSLLDLALAASGLAQRKVGGVGSPFARADSRAQV